MGNIGQIARRWALAGAGWRDNPVANYWRHAEERRLAVVPWYKRSPGLLLWAVLLSLGTTALLVLFILRVLDLRAAGESAVYADVALYSGTSALLLGARLFAWCWLLARWYTIAQLALSFLALQPQPRIRQMLDDLLAVSALSGQEVLAGTGVYCLRLLLPPLLALNALSLAEGVVRGSGDWLGALGPALLLFVLYTLGGCLAALALVFLLISVSLSVRPGLMPVIGAVLQVAMQLALPVAVLALNASSAAVFQPGSDERANFLPLTATYLVLWLLVMFLLLYLARRADWLRRAIGYALPLLLAGIGLVIYGIFALNGELFEFYGEIFLYGLWAAQFLAITAPLPVDAGALSMLFSAADVAGLPSWQVYLLIPAAQLTLLVICAEFARDALSRRKWGKEGE